MLFNIIEKIYIKISFWQINTHRIIKKTKINMINFAHERSINRTSFALNSNKIFMFSDFCHFEIIFHDVLYHDCFNFFLYNSSLKIAFNFFFVLIRCWYNMKFHFFDIFSIWIFIIVKQKISIEKIIFLN